MEDRAQLLLTVTGLDRPGITSEICRVLSNAQAELLDIQQVTISPLLVMALHVSLPVPPGEKGLEPSALVPGELLRLALRLDLQLRVQPFVPSPVLQSPDLFFAVTCLASTIQPAALGAISNTLARHGANIDRITRLTENSLKCIELTVRATGDLDRAELKRALFAVSNEVGVDIAVQPESLYRRSKRLILMDVDSTLIQHEVIDEIARLLGIEKEVATITAQAMAGQLDFSAALTHRVALLAGLEASRLAEVADRLELTPGAETLLGVLKKLGYKTAIVSGGFTFFTDRLKERLNLDYAYANTLEIVDGRLTGRLVGPIIDARGKRECLLEIAKKENIELAQTLAVGDGANDLLMLEAAGLGVAFNAKPVVREAADLSISQPNLDVLLYLIGIRERELAGLV
ncbi:MAG: phosphoserine phosphatase [Chloroflexi bacterium]|jgi:phosphoserine phosphatase|nr:phosphoserine phosphatase [Chloroflexota bacterium]